jgi:uncharacterized SAM-binding protein YcdF (DUF218 family)
MDSVILVRAASVLLLPPANLVLLTALGGLLFLAGRRRAGTATLALSLMLLTLLSMPAIGQWLVARLEADVPVLTQPRGTPAQAIVILGGSRRVNAREYGGSDQPGLYSLGRLRYGAWLHEQTGLPILVTGGSPERRPESEASLMARALKENFKVPVRWMEGASDNTEQNARLSAHLLKQAGITRVLLVSDAWHLPRAMRMFADQGLQPIAAPTNALNADANEGLLAWLPQAGTLTLSHLAMHEWIGLAWYSLRHGQVAGASTEKR